MKLLAAVCLSAVCLPLFAADSKGGQSKAAAEFANRWTRTRNLTIGVAEAMPPDEYGFKPDPPSMSFGELMAHIAWGNYAFCYALKDEKMPKMTDPTTKEGLVKYLTESIDYCTSTLNSLTDDELNALHDSPDGRMPGREVLLAMYVHVAHHRGQGEIYLRIKGIKPPSYVF